MMGFSDSFICRGTININASLQLANILEILSDGDSVGLLDEINLALNGNFFEEIYRPDGSSVDKIEITPPNAIINENFTISLIELKELLEEWIGFVNKY